MTQTPEKNASRWAELSDDVLESVEASRKQAIDAVRKFVDQISGASPMRRGARTSSTPPWT